MSFADWIATIGVSLLLLAYVLDVSDAIADDSPWFFALNAVGAGLACWSAYMIRFWPFVVLEGIWAAVSVVALGRRWLKFEAEDAALNVNLQLQPVYEAEDLVQAQMLLDALSAAGIDGHILGAMLSGVAGELPARGLVRIVVPSQQWTQSRAIAERWEHDFRRSVDAGVSN